MLNPAIGHESSVVSLWLLLLVVVVVIAIEIEDRLR